MTRRGTPPPQVYPASLILARAVFPTNLATAGTRGGSAGAARNYPVRQRPCSRLARRGSITRASDRGRTGWSGWSGTRWSRARRGGRWQAAESSLVAVLCHPPCILIRWRKAAPTTVATQKIGEGQFLLTTTGGGQTPNSNRPSSVLP
jgi:hypothetical protein